ncbi:hypothetical protein ACQEV4_42440 [Streptomyces shenzhenensis]|uniref:hypothetical protein n=1 Tax=Streptomyces shenzhenensis TaxID=943815 RepID=UPI003D8CDCD6
MYLACGRVAVRPEDGPEECPLYCESRRLGGLKSRTGRVVSGGTGTVASVRKVECAVWNDSVEAAEAGVPAGGGWNRDGRS